MLRLRSCVLTHLLSSPTYPLHRLLSAALPAAVSPSPRFAVEDYLVDTCGLTRAHALKASAKLSHLKSPAKPDAVLAFLTGLGLSGAEVAAKVASDPRVLCAGVERTLSPVVAGLTGLGLSRPEIARFVQLAGCSFRCRFVVPRLHYYLHLFGSFENLLRLLRVNSYLLQSDLDRVIKPNAVLLRECGIAPADIAKLCIGVPRLLITNPKTLRTMVACAEGLGVPRGSRMFRHALHAVKFLNKEKVAAKVEHLKKTFRWSDAEARLAVCKCPMVLTRSKEMLQRKYELLVSEVGLEPAYIACRPVILCYSLEGRLRPRCYVLKFLKENGLVDRDWNYNTIFKLTDKLFVEKFICPHREAAPYLAEDYDAACRGEVPSSFRST
uniref:Uncharacterized protein n=4 Tax=Avena sativa TaxID=4498 RepID=A0ACD5V8X0_AVESA